jgi:hypothetical protein
VSYSVKILADSKAPSGHRLTTFEVTFPRLVLAEFNTHRMLSRNSASSRAIPVEKMREKVRINPLMPVYWGRNQKGMQAAEELVGWRLRIARFAWLLLSRVSLLVAWLFSKLDVHKQIANRLLEPWLWQTVIVSATEYENFFALRCHPDAQPEIRRIAEMMRDLYRSSTPKPLAVGEWHLPLVDDYDRLRLDGFSLQDIIKICVGRCTRVSYLTHHGVRDPKADIELCGKLLVSGHMSPFEHAARAEGTAVQSGNFTGFTQYRKTISGEALFAA